MRTPARLAALLLVVMALAASIGLSLRTSSSGQRNLDAVVTMGGDAVHDAMQPALDLTRISSTQEMELGTEIDREVRRSMSIVTDASLDDYLRRLVAKISERVVRQDIAYKAAVVRSPEINAFSLPGGRIYVTEGMLRYATSEAELVSVLAHEISHVDLRHCVERLQLQRVAGKVSPGLGDLVRLGYEIMLRGFSEEQELSADVNAATLAAGAGYDPWASSDMFQRLRSTLERPQRTPTRDPVVEANAIILAALGRYVATHPPAEERMAAIRRSLMASPGSWEGVRRYVGRDNLATRRSMMDDPRSYEWITRLAEPSYESPGVPSSRR